MAASNLHSVNTGFQRGYTLSPHLGAASALSSCMNQDILGRKRSTLIGLIQRIANPARLTYGHAPSFNGYVQYDEPVKGRTISIRPSGLPPAVMSKKTVGLDMLAPLGICRKNREVIDE